MEDFQCGADWQAKQSPWINVNERLPKELEYVLVRGSEGTYAVASRLNGKWLTYVGKVTHWRCFEKLEIDKKNQK